MFFILHWNIPFIDRQNFWSKGKVGVTMRDFSLSKVFQAKTERKKNTKKKRQKKSKKEKNTQKKKHYSKLKNKKMCPSIIQHNTYKIYNKIITANHMDEKILGPKL